MTSYTLHFPKGTTAVDADALTGAVLIRDGFSWGAFLFSFLWLFWNRLWLAGVLVLVALAAIGTAFNLSHVQPSFAALANLLVMILLGLEANSLKRWTFERTGRPVAAIVTGQDYIEAEAKMIALGLHGSQSARPPSPGPVAVSVPTLPASAASPALGLFPALERLR